jgi:predicted TIM-barrel fold metal-dependent hydrolase
MSEILDADFVPQQVLLPALLPHIAREWQGFLTLGGDTSGDVGYALPETVYGVRRPEQSGDPHEQAAERLVGADVSRAVLDPDIAGSLSGMGNPDLAAAIARAANDWQAARWLDADERYRGSILVGPRDPAHAAAEIRRLAGDGRFVQVLLAYPQNLLGDRSLHPIYEAACETGLPVALRSGGAFVGGNRGLAPVGFQTTRFEYELGATYTAQPHLLSLLCNGVFDRFPSLRVIFSGFGVAWLPSLVWRADREFRLGRLDRPRGLSRLPSECLADHVRLTTAPLELPDDVEQLVSLLSLVEGERLLLFASGPLGDRPAELAGLPDDWRRRILADNAAELFRLSVAA